MRRAWLLVLLSACSPEQPVTQTPAEPVVVYAAYADKAYLPGLFERYSDATGVTVIVRHGDRESIVDDLIADNILPPADVIVTPSLRGMTRAADEGALRPLPRSLVGAQVHGCLVRAQVLGRLVGAQVVERVISGQVGLQRVA